MILVEELTGRLSAADRASLARLHLTSLDQGFLGTLGAPVLERLYQAFARHSRTHLYVARSGGPPVGLAVTTENLRSLYLSFGLSGGIALFPRLVPKLLSRRTVVSLFETLRYPVRNAANATMPAPELELINLCVDPETRGLGVGRRLMNRVVDDFASTGGGTLKIVTGSRQIEAHALYHSLGAELVGNLEVHRGTTSLAFALEVQGRSH